MCFEPIDDNDQFRSEVDAEIDRVMRQLSPCEQNVIFEVCFHATCMWLGFQGIVFCDNFTICLILNDLKSPGKLFYLHALS